LKYFAGSRNIIVMNTIYLPTPHEESLAKEVVHCAYIVHNTLGPGLLEAVYEHCFCHELQKRQIYHARQISVPLAYDGVQLRWRVRLDVLVDSRIVCELKAVESLTPVFLAQILTQLKLVDLHLGFLINFNVAVIKEGIRRVMR
jgi:GxxExxY protein